MEKVADASEFRRAAKIVPFTFESWHFGTFRQVVVKLLESFVVEITTVAGPQMAYFVELALDLILKSFSTVSAPVFGLYPRLSFEAGRRNAAVGVTILQTRIVRVRDVEIDPGQIV